MNNAKKSISGKGFYAVLFASVAMIGAAGFFAYNRTAGELEEQLGSIAESIPDTTQRVDASVTDVPKDTTTPQTTTTEEQTTVTETKKRVSAPIRSYVMPVEGEIIHPFSNGELVKSPTTGAWQTHNGTDIAASEGEPVRAMTDGTVISIENDALWGVCVTVDHGNELTARYCGLAPEVNVAQGDKLVSGAEIGKVGRSADIESMQEAHLHFEVRSDKDYVDPINVIDAYSN